MKLIIAEKPELGRDIANALLHTTTETNGAIKSGNYVVTWAFGHLLELKEPEEYDKKFKQWNDSDLPIFFENWEKVPAQDICNREGKIVVNNRYKRNRLELIGKLLENAEMVVHAGDPDEEGQNLIDEILDYFNYHGIVKRVFVNDNIEKNIMKAFQHLIDNETQLPVSNSAYARQMCDKCHGINHSRLAGIRLHRKGLSVGRVQTATLGLVVNRDEAIAKHVKEKYYDFDVACTLSNAENCYDKVIFNFKPSKDLLGDNKHIVDKEVFENIKRSLNEAYGCITEVKSKETYAPLPYNQTVLSADMNRLYGYSLKKTLDITQTLRDKYKAITYNRSDSQYLKNEHFNEAPSVMKIVFANLGKEYPVSFDKKGSCFNDEFAPTHHGIIPQERNVDLSALSNEERNVYIAIAERYIMQFLPPVLSNVSTSTFGIETGVFAHVSSKVVDKGWKQYFLSDTENEDYDTLFIEDGKYSVTSLITNILEKETKPLSKYSEGTLVKDMTSISKYVKDPVLKQALKDKDKGKKGENGSIGTVATRGAILETLLKRGFLVEEGKHIVSTDLGKEFYHLIPTKIKTADITAKWWLIQEEIKAGEKNVNALMLEDVEEFESIRKRAYYNATLEENTSNRESVGLCPVCGKPVYEGKNDRGKSWYCSGYKDGCKFKLYEYTKRFADTVKLNTGKVKKLLSGKTIEATLTSKEGKKYEANLKLKMNKEYPNLEVDSFINKKK